MSMIGMVIRLSDDEAKEMLSRPEEVYDLIQERDYPTVDLDKTWDGLRFLLQRLHPNEPLASFLVQGGLEVGDDLGYGPGRAYLSPETAAIRSLLERTTVEDLKGVYDSAALKAAGIYPEIWDLDPTEDDPFGYLAAHFERLKAFVQSAAGESLITWIE